MTSLYEQVKETVIADPMNEKYTKQGIEPLFSAPEAAKIAIVGQAPGIHAQQTMKYWNDQSGKRLRQWMNVTDEQFYDSDIFAIVPMDFYYPGKGKSGDLPPRKEFANKYPKAITDKLPQLELILLVGAYAQKFYLKKDMHRNLTETVKHYKEYLPNYFPIVHPSPLNYGWMNKNPWFEEAVIPDLQQQVNQIINN